MVTGSISGTFTGTVSKIDNRYTAVGTFKPNIDLYDFDFPAQHRDFWGNLATGLGALGGQYEGLVGRQPKPYEVYFDGSLPVNMSW